MDFFGFLSRQHAQEKTLAAVLPEDLFSALKAINKLDDLDQGRIFCSICGTIITMQNLQLIVPVKDNDYVWICNDPKCVESYGHSTASS